MKAIAYPSEQAIVVAPRRKPRQAKQGSNPALTALAYRGPLLKPRATEGNESEVYQIMFSASLASSAAGVLATVFDPASQITSSPDWTNIQNLWEEYRVLSWKFETKPHNKYYGPTTNVLPALYSVIDRQTATALASVADAVGFGSCEIHSMSDDIRRSSKMTGPDESTWVSTGTVPAAAAQAYLKLYSNGITNSITLMTYMMVYLVQVKGRK